jgi:septal ring factor EnvC (AmiA/AmiB activator)
MPLRTILILFAAGAIALFAALNWSAFTAPTTLHFGFGTVDAPLGLIMLGLTVLLAFLFLIFVIYLQATVLLEGRRHTRELQAQRELAEQAETSRYSQLRQFLETELQKHMQQSAQERADVLARLDQLERELRTTIEQSANTLAACVGEIDDLLQRKVGAQDQIKPKP